jgi:hypothetical protein
MLFAWIVSQQRGASSTIAPPILRIESPTDQSGWTTEDATIDLAGIANHGGETIESVAWNRLGGDEGTANGTTSWSIAGVPLDEGENLIRVIATAPSLHDAYGGHTTFNDALRVNRAGPPPPPGTIVAAVNAGGAAYTASDGTEYAADNAFEGGAVQVSDVEVANTDDDALYNDWRYGNFRYHIPVYPGRYTVELDFADTFNTAPGQRIFDAAIEGTPVLTHFDIIAEAGANTATVRVFDVEVSDGVLDIALTNGDIGNARLDAFRVIRGDDDALFADGFDAR